MVTGDRGLSGGGGGPVGGRMVRLVTPLSGVTGVHEASGPATVAMVEVTAREQ